MHAFTVHDIMSENNGAGFKKKILIRNQVMSHFYNNGDFWEKTLKVISYIELYTSKQLITSIITIFMTQFYYYTNFGNSCMWFWAVR